MRVGLSVVALAAVLGGVVGCERQRVAVAHPAAPMEVSVAPPSTTSAETAREIVAANQPGAAPAAGPTAGAGPGEVRAGNQTALGPAAVPFASYLNAIHNRIHPEFADKELAKLDALGRAHPLNDTKLVVNIELVLDGATGAIAKLGVIKASGVSDFDTSVLDSLKRAAPFGAAPLPTRSPDRYVYLHWEFHRDEVFACSTMHARPFLLRP
jgi:hypothetical protein